MNNQINTSRILTESILYPEDLIEAYIIPSDSALDNNENYLETFL